MAVKRPGGVTLVAILTWIGGALDILGGAILLTQAGDEGIAAAFGGTSGLYTSAIILILIGIVVIVVAGGLLRGSNTARAIVTVVQLFAIASGIYLIIVFPATAVSEAIGLAVSLFVLLLLWTGRANEFFRT